MSKIFEALQKAEEDREFAVAGGAQEENAYADPLMDLSQQLVVLGRPGSEAAEQFRLLRSEITRPREGVAPRTVMITSSIQGEGKTFIACNLAVTVAQGLDEYVLLVDADLRNPNVHRAFGLGPCQEGLATYLEQEKPLSGLLRKTVIPKLTVLPAGQDVENPAELLSSRIMRDFIAEVRDRYPDRLIILDSSPVEPAPETLVLANEVDAVYLVLKRGITSRHVASSTMERFQEGKLRGIVFNGEQSGRRSSYDKYGYGYRIGGASG